MYDLPTSTDLIAACYKLYDAFAKRIQIRQLFNHGKRQRFLMYSANRMVIERVNQKMQPF